jgi:hypothetical protein
MLKEGIDIDILNNYHPYNNKRVIEKLENELLILEEILEETNENILSESNEDETGNYVNESNEIVVQDANIENIKEAIKETKNVITTLKENENKIKKSKFEEFYHDFELRTWYTNGEIISKLSSNEKKWQENYEKIIEFVKKNKKTPPDSNINKLGAWCSKNRIFYRNGSLSEEKIKLLESIPEWKWDLDLEEIWQEKYIKVNNFISKNNKYPTVKYEKEKTLANWCAAQRQNYIKGKLSEEKIKKLEELNNWIWTPDEKWDIRYEQFKKFALKNNKLPSQHSKIKEEKILGFWCSRQRQNYKKGELDKEEIKQLEEITIWKWYIFEGKWKDSYKSLEIFVKKNNKIPSNKSKIEKEKILGGWCSNQRTDYKKENLSEERIKQLEEIPGWFWTKEEKTSKQAIKQETIKQETKLKIRKTKTFEEEKEKLKNLTNEELLDQLVKLKLQNKSNYQAINPIEKNEINELFSKNIKGSGKGIVIVLDDPEFKSAKTLIKHGIDKDRIMIPNNSDKNEIMMNDKIFGKCVKKCSLQSLLNTFIENQLKISGIYADLMGSFNKEIPILQQIIECNLDKDTVIGFTISARENQGANFTNGFSNKLLNKMSQKFNDNLIENDEGVYVYGEKMRMATCVFKNIKK